MEKPCIVLKIGSASLVSEIEDKQKANLRLLVGLVETVTELRQRGFDVIIVTSGAVSFGCMRLGISRPKELGAKQALAAVGQARLMRLYEDFFSHHDQPIAQVLLSRENLSLTHHFKNIQATIRNCFKMGIVPIINENDTVAVEEIRFGDNDTLSALVASVVDAQWLVLLTDVDNLYSADPRKDPDAKPILVVEDVFKLQEGIASKQGGSNHGTGGMYTKIQAARIASTHGTRTLICRSTCVCDRQKLGNRLQNKGELVDEEYLSLCYLHNQLFSLYVSCFF